MKIVLHQLQNVRYNIDNVFDFNDQKTFSCKLVKNFVEIDSYTRIETLVNEERKYVDNSEEFVVINKFSYEQLFELIILHINTILLKVNFNFLIRNFILIIDFKMSNNKKIILNV